MTLEELIVKWNAVPDDPDAIMAFCLTIPPELEARFTLWLMDLKALIDKAIADRKSGSSMVN